MEPVAVLETNLTIALLLAGFLVFVGIVKGTSGFGSGLLAVPVVVQLLPAKLALAALTLTLWVGNVPILLADGIEWSFLRAHRGLVAGAVVGVVVGLAGLAIVPVPVVYLLIAGFILTFLVLDHQETLVTRLAARRGAGTATGWIGGVVTGAFLTGGPVFVSYLHAKRTDKTRFATTMALMLFIMTSIRIGSLTGVGTFGGTAVWLGAGFLVPLGIGVVGGTRLRPYIPQRGFRRFVEVLLAVIALKLAADGATALLAG